MSRKIMYILYICVFIYINDCKKTAKVRNLAKIKTVIKYLEMLKKNPWHEKYKSNCFLNPKFLPKQ